MVRNEAQAKPEKQATTSIDTFLDNGSDARLRELVSLMYAAAGRLQSMRRELARSLNIGAAELSVLLTLYGSPNNGGMRIKEIADNLHIAAANVTASVNTLERQNWIGKASDRRDSRAILVSLTAEGRERLDRFASKLRSVNDIWFADISAREYSHVTRFLKRIISQFDSAFYAAKIVDWDE
jgi:DNA-binding MarR family transcriptional regulator